MQEVKVSGFPTLKLFKYDEVIDYSGDRSFKDLVKFMDEHLGTETESTGATEDEESDEVEEVEDEGDAPAHEEL